MNITKFNAVPNKGGSLFGGNLPILQKTAMKSTQEKAERQQKTTGQIEFWEKQKENLKNMECSTLEDIARKLEMFHTYEDEIAAVRKQYNMEQMQHAMDEAKELGEKMAEKAEKLEPKTAEERREEMAEKAFGTDEGKGILTECMEELSRLTEELAEEAKEIDRQEELLQEELAQENLESTDSADI